MDQQAKTWRDDVDIPKPNFAISKLVYLYRKYSISHNDSVDFFYSLFAFQNEFTKQHFALFIKGVFIQIYDWFKLAFVINCYLIDIN